MKSRTSVSQLTPKEREGLARAANIALSVGGNAMTLNELRDKAHANAVAHGFYDRPREFGTAIALIHSEVSEALEAYRECNYLDAIAEELADIIIRVADLAGYMNIDLEEAVISKMRYNEMRPYKHGKRF